MYFCATENSQSVAFNSLIDSSHRVVLGNSNNCKKVPSLLMFLSGGKPRCRSLTSLHITELFKGHFGLLLTVVSSHRGRIIMRPATAPAAATA